MAVISSISYICFICGIYHTPVSQAHDSNKMKLFPFVSEHCGELNEAEMKTNYENKK